MTFLLRDGYGQVVVDVDDIIGILIPDVPGGHPGTVVLTVGFQDVERSVRSVLDRIGNFPSADHHDFRFIVRIHIRDNRHLIQTYSLVVIGSQVPVVARYTCREICAAIKNPQVRLILENQFAYAVVVKIKTSDPGKLAQIFRIYRPPGWLCRSSVGGMEIITFEFSFGATHDFGPVFGISRFGIVIYVCNSQNPGFFIVQSNLVRIGHKFPESRFVPHVYARLISREISLDQPPRHHDFRNAIQVHIGDGSVTI